MMDKNPFQEIYDSVEPPQQLRREVMESIRVSQLMIDLADLFTVTSARTFGSIASDVIDPDNPDEKQ